MNLTAVLLNYRRPDDLARLIMTLKNQSEPVKIILGDNAETPHPCRNFADKYVHVPWNAGTFLRIYLSFWVDTEWVMFMDDDREPKDREFVHDALISARRHPGGITGAIGRRFFMEAPHYREDAFGPCEIVKGLTLLFQRSLLPRVPVAPPLDRDMEWVNRADDMHLSLSIGKGKPVHHADQDLYDRLHDHDKRDVGLTADPRHNDIREVVAKDYAGLLAKGAL